MCSRHNFTVSEFSNFARKVSGTKRTRPELARMIDQLRAGDVMIVTKSDRLSRSLQDLLGIVETM
jgi:DNA invertase Pin-like site-specific DNA recombinase